MKKGLSIVAALASVVTIGGVYATWTYANDAAPAKTSTMHIKLTDAEFEGTVGTIKVTSDGSRIVFDDTNNDYVAEMVIFDSNNVKTDKITYAVTFTGNDGADNEDLELTYTVTISGFIYNGETFLKLADSITGTFDKDGGKIEINETDFVFTPFSLPTHDDYMHMVETLETATIIVNVEDTTVRSGS